MVVSPEVLFRRDGGSQLIAVLFSVGLWGITCVQTLFYFIHYSNDGLCLRAMVAWLWLVDTAHQLLLITGVYEELIIHFCNYEQVQQVKVEYLWQVLLTVLVALPAQLFFVNRLAKFSGRKRLFLALWAPVATLEFTGAVAFITYGTIQPTWKALTSPFPSGMFTILQLAAASIDLSITAGLIYLLIRSKEDAQYKMRTVIQKLLMLSLGTGVWTALFAIFTVITMFTFPDTLVYVALTFPLCPLYCNTALANLNARQVIETLEHRPARDSVTLWRDTASSTGPSPGSGLVFVVDVSTAESQSQLDGLDQLVQAQTTSFCRYMSGEHRRTAEASVQAPGVPGME